MGLVTIFFIPFYFWSPMGLFRIYAGSGAGAGQYSMSDIRRDFPCTVSTPCDSFLQAMVSRINTVGMVRQNADALLFQFCSIPFPSQASGNPSSQEAIDFLTREIQDLNTGDFCCSAKKTERGDFTGSQEHRRFQTHQGSPSLEYMHCLQTISHGDSRSCRD